MYLYVGFMKKRLCILGERLLINVSFLYLKFVRSTDYIVL